MLWHLQKFARSVFGSFDGCSKIQKDGTMKYFFISKGMVVFLVILYTKWDLGWQFFVKPIQQH